MTRFRLTHGNAMIELKGTYHYIISYIGINYGSLFNMIFEKLDTLNVNFQKILDAENIYFLLLI